MNRSELMARIRSKWTLTEVVVHNWLKGNKIKHKMHPQITMNPDACINEKIYLFIDGCFWHGCELHYKLPKTNIDYWKKHIGDNIKRDTKRDSLPYKWVKIWEHDVKNKKFKEILKNACA